MSKPMKTDDSCNDVEPAPSLAGQEITDDEKGVVVHDVVFGDITESGPNYRDVSRRQHTPKPGPCLVVASL